MVRHTKHCFKKYYYYYYYPYRYLRPRSQVTIAGGRPQISMPHHMDPVGVKNKGVGSASSLGPPLRVDTTCLPISLMDDVLFLFICFEVLSCSSSIIPQCGRLFSKAIETAHRGQTEAQTIARGQCMIPTCERHKFFNKSLQICFKILKLLSIHIQSKPDLTVPESNLMMLILNQSTNQKTT